MKGSSDAGAGKLARDRAIWESARENKSYAALAVEHGLPMPSIRRIVSDFNRIGRSIAGGLRDDTGADARRSTNKASERRIAVLSDPHGMPDETVIDALAAEAPDIVVWSGDILDAHQLSTHNDEKSRFEALSVECARMRATLEAVAARIPGVRQDLMYGNHDQRITAAFRDNPFWLTLSPYFTDPLEALIAGIANARVVETEFRWHTPDRKSQPFTETRFICLYGDAIVSHASFSDKWAGGAARKLWLWLQRWKNTLALPDLRLYVQGHGHKISFAEDDGGHVVLVEPGMTAKAAVEGYKVGYRGNWAPGALGFLVFDQARADGLWLTDLASAHLIRPGRRPGEQSSADA